MFIRYTNFAMNVYEPYTPVKQFFSGTGKRLRRYCLLLLVWYLLY